MIASIFIAAWKNYKKNFLLLSAIEFLPILVLIIGIVTLRYSNIFGETLGDSLVIFAGLISLWSQFAAMYLLRIYAPRSVVRSYASAFANTFSYLWIIVLSLAIVSVAGLIVGVLGLGVFYLLIKIAPVFINNNLQLLLNIYVIAVFLSALYYYLRIIYAPFILMDENITGINAVAKSENYIKNRYLRSFFALCIGILPFVLLSWLSYWISFRSELYSEIFSILIYILGLPFVYSYIFETYRHLKMENTGAEVLASQRKRTIYLAIAGLAIYLGLYLLSKF